MSVTNFKKVLVVNDTRVDNHYGCYAVMSAIEELLNKNNMKVEMFWPAHNDWRKNANFEKKLKTVDLVLVNGEGTIHHDRPAGKCLLEIGKKARMLCIPSVLINVGWDENSSDLLVFLDNFNLVSARDSTSANLMSRGGANVRVVPDLSFWFAQRNKYSVFFSDKKPDLIGVTDNIDRLKSLKLEKQRLCCGGQTISITTGSSGFLGWLKFLRNGVSLSKDILNPIRFIKLLLLRNRLYRNRDEDFSSFMHNISKLKLLISGRFHACTLALSLKIPIIAQSSNTGKISALFYDVGLDPWRCNDVTYSENLLKIGPINWTCNENNNLDFYLKESITLAEELFKDIEKLTRA